LEAAAAALAPFDAPIQHVLQSHACSGSSCGHRTTQASLGKQTNRVQRWSSRCCCTGSKSDWVSALVNFTVQGVWCRVYGAGCRLDIRAGQLEKPTWAAGEANVGRAVATAAAMSGAGCSFEAAGAAAQVGAAASASRVSSTEATTHAQAPPVAATVGKAALPLRAAAAAAPLLGRQHPSL